MKFVIALCSYFESVGFSTADWRKSVDGTQAIVHAEYAKALISNIEQDSNVTIYTMPSTELQDLLNSPEWTGN